MKKNVSFLFPEPADIDSIREMSDLQMVQRSLKALFSKYFPMMIFPFKVFYKKGKIEDKIY